MRDATSDDAVARAGTPPVRQTPKDRTSRGLAAGAGGGAITRDDSSHSRVLDVSARVGSPDLDNTHEIRSGGGGPGGGGGFGAGGATSMPLDDDPDALRAAIWQATDQKIKAAQER